MAERIANIFLLVIFLSVIAAFGQTATPEAAPSKAEPAKANTRPMTTSAALAEAFDTADIKTMAAKCVELETELGDIEAEMYPESAPESVRNFLNLVAIGAFDTTTFSRVVPGFVIQGGSIWTRLGGVSSELGRRARRTIPDEPNKILHERGIFSMARTDEPNTATSNFFILVSAGQHLDGTFAAFGRVTKGMEVVDEINKAPVSAEKPEKPVRIKKASIQPCIPTAN